MAVSDELDRQLHHDPEVLALTGAAAGTPLTPAISGGGLLGIAVVLGVLWATVLSDIPTIPRYLTIFVALGAFFGGLRYVTQAIWGPSFDTGFWLSVLWLVLLIFCAVFADLLPIKPYDENDLVNSRQSPNIEWDEPLGTDEQGRSILSRVIYGARASLAVGFLSAGIGMVVGGAMGLLAGYLRGKTETVFGFLTDSMLAFPPLVFLLAVVAIWGGNLQVVVLALGVVGIPTFARITRANTLTFAQREFVLAARSMGATTPRVVFRELLPNVLLPVMSYAFIIIALLIVAEGTLSFLGLGIQPPTPTWGQMIGSNPRAFQDGDPHLIFAPAVVMFLTVFAFNRVGDVARRRFEGREAVV